MKVHLSIILVKIPTNLNVKHNGKLYKIIYIV